MTMTDHPAGKALKAEDCICGGAGTVFVDDDYVRRHVLPHINDTERELSLEAIAAALAWSVIPCYECRPQQYRLWSTGHYERGHKPCAECRPPKRTGKGRRQ